MIKILSIAFLFLAVLVGLFLIQGNLGVNSESSGSDRPNIVNSMTRESILSEMLANGWLRKGYTEWYVSAKGRATGTGKVDSPLDLEAALLGGNKRAVIQPGDIVWLRGGSYKGAFTARTAGKAGSPLHFRQYPGERAVLDKASIGRSEGTLSVRGSHLWFWDFEVSNSHPDRKKSDSEGEISPRRGSGINVWAPNTKFINLTVRDNGHGFGVWTEEGDVEIYGCLIFNNGNNKKEHGIYAHNRTGNHRFANNFIFNNAGYGLHIYANTTKSAIRGFQVEDNTVFGNGALTGLDQAADQILIGGVAGVAARRVRLIRNVVYTDPEAPNAKSRGIRLGYRHRANGDVALYGNLVVAKVPLKILWWTGIDACGNTFISPTRGIEVELPARFNYSDYRFSGNTISTYKNPERTLRLNGGRMAMAQWHQLVGESKCEFEPQRKNTSPESPRVFVRQNEYDRSVAYITVYDREANGEVSIDLSEVLQIGERFSIWDVENRGGDPVVSGVFEGKRLLLPSNGKTITLPAGQTERVPVHSNAEFSAFVLRKEFSLAKG